MRKIIKLGVSSCFFYPDLNREVFGAKTLNYFERDMARYLMRDDVLPILIPDLEGTDLEKFLSQMDGFVFQGGSDIAPETYGEAPIGNWKGDRHRDQYELKIMKYGMDHGKPAFGICRGMQLMNVHFGGTLFQDIEIQRPNSIDHRDAIQYDQWNHELEVPPGTIFTDLHDYDKTSRVNSIHHQGVKDLGKDLEVWANCKEDGIVEAFGWKGADPGKVFGVQWHPEFFWNSKTELIIASNVYDLFLTFC